MDASRRLPGLLLLSALATAFAGTAATAQDVLRVASVAGEAGARVSVPIRLRDRRGTPLGNGGAPGGAFRGFSITVEYSPASAVEEINVYRAGVTSDLAGFLDTVVSHPPRVSRIVALAEDIPFSGDTEIIARIDLKLASGAPPGRLDLSLVAETTALSNGAGTLVETEPNGGLELVDGGVWITSSCTTERTLCLLDDRFRVEVDWTDFRGATGTGHAVRLTSDAGYFWFFDDDNVELIIKALDGRSVNGNFWVFYGALSNVAYEITVTDSVTGAVARYRNPSGVFASAGDTGAFPGDGSLPPGGVEERRAEPPPTAPVEQTGCAAAENALCLLDGRFRLEMAWADFNGNRGAGKAVGLTDDAGYFWFFNRDNVEVVVKALDGRNINGRFWVFYGALSNVEFTLTVTDTETGEVRTYRNPLGTFASVGDTGAF